jgi:hypothetical protein
MAGQLSATVAAPYSSDLLQRLIDQAACFHLFAIPDGQRFGPALHAPGDTHSVIGIRASQALHRFEISLELPVSGSVVRAANTVGELSGRLDLLWLMIPDDYAATPDREPPVTRLDPSRSQRFVMREMTFTFGDGRDGFRSFGTGRTFPTAGKRPALVAAAVGNVVEGVGRFCGHEGNFTLCGELSAERGFLGHLVVRIADPRGNLRTLADLPPIEAGPDPDPGTTYLMWAAQKGAGQEQQNFPSLGPDGKLRGLNIPVELKLGSLGFSARGSEGFRSAEFRAGEVIGKEIGFGRGSFPDAPPTGTALTPYQFEGIAQYSFHDRQARDLGAIRSNVVEGRGFDMTLPDAPGEVAWRFGFFGPIILGLGCFRGVQGMFYGASASVFKMPPEAHVITHLYMARLNDPDSRFRAHRRARAAG